MLTENLDNELGFEQTFSTAGRTDKVDGLVEKRPNFHQNQIRESDACERENLQMLYIINLISLVAFEKFELLLMTSAVIYNNCSFTKQH